MIPATSQNSKTFREHIGPAVWLLALLACSTPAGWSGDSPVYVAGGNVVTDAELAERLGVSKETIARWCRRLRAAGVIGWLVAPKQGRVFWIGAVNHIFAAHGEGKPFEKPAERPVDVKAESLSEPVTPRWIQ